jgi:protein-S-isoprenylcysteine O-methyltransferase Ste14
MTDQTDLADRIAWGRARAATVMAVVFVAAQAGSFPDSVSLNRPQTIHLAAWIVWAAALLFFLAFAGGLFRGARMRALLNDETTLDHRKRAMALGFWGAIGTAALVYAISFYEPISAREGARLIITFAIALALLRFGTLERRALKDG